MRTCRTITNYVLSSVQNLYHYFYPYYGYPQEYVTILQEAYELKNNATAPTSLPEHWEWHEAERCNARMML